MDREDIYRQVRSVPAHVADGIEFRARMGRWNLTADFLRGRYRLDRDTVAPRLSWPVIAALAEPEEPRRPT